MNNHSDIVGFIWSVADKLRGIYKQSEYGRVMLRRLDCVLEPTRAEVLAEVDKPKTRNIEGSAANKFLLRAADQSFYNTSPMDTSKLGSFIAPA